MTSIRMQLMLQLVDRLAAIDGWNSQLRDVENPSDFTISAVVFEDSENKSNQRTNTQYLAELRVAVLIKGRADDADDVIDGGNAYRYLDRLVTAAEKVVHAPDSWGPNPLFDDVMIEGHEVFDPTDVNEVEALLRLTFRYRHDFQNPEQF